MLYKMKNSFLCRSYLTQYRACIVKTFCGLRLRQSINSQAKQEQSGRRRYRFAVIFPTLTLPEVALPFRRMIVAEQEKSCQLLSSVNPSVSSSKTELQHKSQISLVFERRYPTVESLVLKNIEVSARRLSASVNLIYNTTSVGIQALYKSDL